MEPGNRRQFPQPRRIAPEEGRRLLDDLQSRVEDERDEVRQRFFEEIQSAARSLELPTREDVERLTLALQELEKRVALVEAKEVEMEALTD